VYTSKADLWSCGVITYMLLSSHRPFYHKQRDIMIDRIMRASYSFDKAYWEPISSDAKNFIDQLLVLDPMQRMDAGHALEHAWLTKETHLSDRLPDPLTSEVVKESLVNYKNTSELTKIALNVIAHKVRKNVLENIQEYDGPELNDLYWDRGAPRSQARPRFWNLEKSLMRSTKQTMA
jgi:calcium-dependent protein kinase